MMTELKRGEKRYYLYDYGVGAVVHDFPMSPFEADMSNRTTLANVPVRWKTLDELKNKGGGPHD